MRITIKLGGSILEETAVRMSLLAQITDLKKQGHEIILVHGGGKRLNQRLAQMNMTSRFLEGLRVTDAETLGVAVMVLAGEVNKRIVTEMAQLGISAIGLCGADAGAVRCVRIADLPGYPSGLGFVGKATDVNRTFWDHIMNAGLTPVLCSIALGPDSQLYNVNADQMASVCASGTGSQSLVYLTDVPGVKDDGGAVLPGIGKAEIMQMRSRGTLSGGMLPKTDSCLEALAAGVASVHILPGSSPDILHKYINGSLTEGTRVYGNN